ncbi:MAG: CO dehydrogenase/CO-methylating acetyl-CoA synthase complex subunit beta, partial [Dehalococcoidia bacterium]|nr:CO dehydrogenase/CO-methylating acetyl-CoA synthase complex subunit beta [Dehalococcoidia bacterium]
MDRWGTNETVGFPNTTYYLPTIYGIWGIPVKKLGDLEQVVKRCQSLIPDDISEKHSIESALNAGVATLIAEETIEAIKYLETPTGYIHGENITEDNIWMGAADADLLRKIRVETLTGTAQGEPTFI